MIRILIIITLILGCNSPKTENPIYYYHGRYATEDFHDDFPNLLLLGKSMHGDYAKYLTPDKQIIRAFYNREGRVWRVIVRPPLPNELESYSKVINKTD
jgi:hypothetical protein